MKSQKSKKKIEPPKPPKVEPQKKVEPPKPIPKKLESPILQPQKKIEPPKPQPFQTKDKEGASLQRIKNRLYPSLLDKLMIERQEKEVLKKELNKTLIVVVRYFGGTLLGTGLLTRSYLNAANLSTVLE